MNIFKVGVEDLSKLKFYLTIFFYNVCSTKLIEIMEYLGAI